MVIDIASYVEDQKAKHPKRTLFEPKTNPEDFMQWQAI